MNMHLSYAIEYDENRVKPFDPGESAACIVNMWL